MNRFIISFLLFLIFMPLAAHAQCANPPAAMGVIIFNKAHKVMQYCNGDDWVGLRGGGSGGAAPAGAVMAFDLNDCPDGWTALASAQGRFLVGTGGGYNLGDTGGANSVPLTVAQLPAHNHTGTTSSDGAHSHSWTRSHAGGETVANTSTIGGGWRSAATYTWSTNTAGAHTHSLTTNNTGSGQAHENRPPYLALLYCRKD